MTILVTVASRHGSTREIGEVIAQELHVAGHSVEVHDVDDVAGVEAYDAVIIGSAVYVGSWLAEARQFVERNQVELAHVPVWLFSSGPLGQENPHPPGDPTQLDELMKAAGARSHQIFVGKLDKRDLGLGERLMVRMVGAPEGDFRDWSAIREWTREIAKTLETSTVAHA